MEITQAASLALSRGYYNGPFTTRYIPPETVSTILEMFRQRDGCTLAEYYAARANILKTNHRRFIFNHPPFWQDILIDSRTSLDYLRFCLRQTAGHDFHLEVWFADAQAFTRTARYGGVERFIASAMQIVASVFHRCLTLRIHAASTHIVHCVVRCFSDFFPSKLNSIVTVYNIVDYLQYDPWVFNAVEFREPPTFELVCPPAQSILLTSGAISYPSIAYTSSSKSGVVVTCPEDFLPSIWEYTGLIASAPSATHVELNDIACAALPSPLIIPPPLAHVRSLTITFNGNMDMAETVARLVFVALDRVTFTIQSKADMECMGVCTTILASVLEVAIVGSCRHAQGFQHLFRLMHHVQILDFSRANTALWNEFRIASSAFVRESTNFLACPQLAHIFAPDVSLRQVKRLLKVRARTNYRKLVSVVMPASRSPFSDRLLEWFGNSSVEVSVI
ncbi:hypothetical protein B0H16DRAFT_1481017 [Mycena metata]|uniref:Uncharacterized protein n=1 Tax=Mycena metata TaxID=1033252 RepID=A0AAD7MBE6_9AGAR|nr:hypothetical protein B0H16DRAFT_1481017 [Mycena metata]